MERAWADESLRDAFGFHALQLGLPELPALENNRILHRWVGQNGPQPAMSLITASDRSDLQTLWCDFDALPFPDACLDLLVMPHALELARDPHQTLREAERVLVPEGRLWLSGFNPLSLWQLGGWWGARAGPESDATSSPSRRVGYARLRDWLKLLSFEVDAAHFGGFRPPRADERWLERLKWMDRWGERWLPYGAAVYGLSAVKRVRGMHLVAKARRWRPVRSPAEAALARWQGSPRAQNRPEPTRRSPPSNP